MSENREYLEYDEDIIEAPKAPQYPPRKSRRKKKKSFAGKFSYILFVLGVSFILSGFIIITANDVFALVKDETSVIIDIEDDSVSAKDVSKILKENGVIKFPWAFRLYSSLTHYDEFKSGKFELDTSMDYGQIINNLMRVSTYTETVEVTIPEGYTLAQIAELMENSMVCSKDDLLETAATYEFKHDFLQDIPMEENRLEGFLFPDTYEFYKNDKPVNVLNKMLNNFDSKYSDDLQKAVEETGYSLYEIITIASMVEREAVLASEQSTIAGVIMNRLNDSADFPYLNIDATVQYALGEHKSALTSEDLKVDSPYNTYIYKGLPKGPICNPGMGAILASINPESHNYYYYVASGDESGSHIFSKTLEEHNQARESVKQN